MTDDPIPEITDLQNKRDEAELRLLTARLVNHIDALQIRGYAMSAEFPKPTQEQEKEYAAQLAKAEAARNELRIMAMSPENIRRRSMKRLLTKITLAGIAILAWVALVVVVKYLYVNF